MPEEIKISDDGTPSERPESGVHESQVRNSRIAWLQVVGAFCLNINTWGLLGSFGIYQTYYSLHLLQDSSASKISWIGSVQGFFMFLISFFIGPIFDAGHLNLLLWVGSTLSVLGLFMTSLCHHYWQFFLAQGVTMGIGFGCLYLPAPALVSMHFDKNQALAMGLSSSGSGIGAVIFPLVFNQLHPNIGFAWATRVLAFILLATSAVPIAIMQFPTPTPADNAANEHYAPSSSPLVSSAKFTQFCRNLVDATALGDVPFILLIAGLLTTFMGIYTILYYINLLAVERTSAADNLSSSILIILNGASTVGRILPSVLADRIGPTHVLAATAFFAGALAFCSLALETAASIVVWAIIFGSTAGAFMGLPAAGVVSVSNSRNNIGARLGMTLGAVGCGVLIAEPIAGAILGRPEGGWLGLVAWSGALMLAGFIFLVAARTTKVGWKIRTVI
ncbi:major facilitator superfamily domain-containing protein [Phaeosphaeriaceae sp. PMI808]|nr:major facilitator superfamily domain-containing protein [Phaeosphaeriaceae sp. PMI808]